MKYTVFPIQEEIAAHARLMPEIEPAAVLAMLRILQASSQIRDFVFADLETKYQLSEGKLSVMIVLHQHPQGIAPSLLAENAGVSRATISAMLRRMIRDKQAYAAADSKDGRGKVIRLSQEGRAFMEQILPGHFLRISQIMGALNQEEQNQLIQLLQKLGRATPAQAESPEARNTREVEPDKLK